MVSKAKKKKAKSGKEGVHTEEGLPWGAVAKWGVKSIYMGLPLTKSGATGISKYIIVMDYDPLNKKGNHEPMLLQ